MVGFVTAFTVALRIAGLGIKGIGSVLSVFVVAVKDIYGVTRTVQGYLSLSDVKHALAVGLAVFVAVLKFASGVLLFLSAISADLSTWQAALAGALATIATGIAKYLTAGTSTPAQA